MASIEIPDLHDFASARAGKDAIARAQVLIDDATLIWSILAIESAVADRPSVACLTFHGRSGEPVRISAGMRHAGHDRTTDFSFAFLSNMAGVWTPRQLAEAGEAQKLFDEWAQDGSFDLFGSIIFAQTGSDPVWLFRSEASPLDAKDLCHRIQREDLWARTEAARIAQGMDSQTQPTPDSGPSREPPRL